MAVVVTYPASTAISYPGIGGGGGGGSTVEAEQRTITAGEEASKSLLLVDVPAVANAVILKIAGAGDQIYGLDYTVSGATLSWNGLGLDGLLQENDEVSIIYFT